MIHIINKELKELLRDGRFKMASIILVVLLIIASFTGFSQYKRNNLQHEESKRKERSNWESQGQKNPHSAAHYGTYVFKPQFALSLFDYGITKYTGNSIFLEAHNRNEAQFSEASDQTSLTRFGTLSINFVLLYLIPLIIILIGYNSSSKEKELQTNILLKSQGIHPAKMILGKWSAIFIPTFLGVTFLFFVIGIVLSNLENITFFSWYDLVALFFLYIIYYMIMVTITLLVSTWSKTSGISLVSCLALWIAFCFITPKVATNLVNHNYPYASQSEFSAAIEMDLKNGLDGHNPWNEAAKQLKKETLIEFGVDSVSQLSFNYDAYRMQKGEEHEAEIYAKHYSDLDKITQKQNETYQRLSFISPFIPLRFLSMDIANTSYDLHWDFMNKTEAYRIEMQEFLNYDFKDNSKTGEWDYEMNAETFIELPKFSFIAPNIWEVINRNLQNIHSLLLWLILPFGGLILSSKKI